MVNEKEFLGWKDKVNGNPEIKKHGFKLVNIKAHYFYMILSFLFLLVFVCFVGGLFYLGYEGKLSSTYENVINPLFNASVQVENIYTFTPATENIFEFNPNHTIIVNIPENLCGVENG